MLGWAITGVAHRIGAVDNVLYTCNMYRVTWVYTAREGILTGAGAGGAVYMTARAKGNMEAVVEGMRSLPRCPGNDEHARPLARAASDEFRLSKHESDLQYQHHRVSKKMKAGGGREGTAAGG